MEKYNYRESVKEDVKEYIREYLNSDDMTQFESVEEFKEFADSSLADKMFISDSVTGNASGSYTFNAWKAEENLCHNLDLLGKALTEFGETGEYITDRGAEACDVTIRCYLLGEMTAEALKEMEDEIEAAIESANK